MKEEQGKDINILNLNNASDIKSIQNKSNSLSNRNDGMFA